MASACGYAGDSNWNNTLWASMGHADFLRKERQGKEVYYFLTKKGFEYLEEFGF